MPEEYEENNEEMSAAKSFLSARKEKKEQEKNATKHLATTAGKGAASYFGGPIGGTAANEVANTKQGDKVLDKASSKLNKIPGVGRTAKELEDRGITDAADQAINAANMAGSKAGVGASNPQQDSGLGDFFSKVNQRKANQNKGRRNAGDTPQEQETGTSQEKPSLSPIKNMKNKATDSMKPSSLDEGNPDDSVGTKAVGNMGKGLAKVAGALTGIVALPLAPILIVIILISGVIGIFFASSTTSNIIDGYSVDYLISEKWGETLVDFEVDDSMYEKDQINFVDRIIDIATEYQENGQEFNPHLISAVQYVIAQYNEKFTYNKMTDGVMRELVDLMFDADGFYNEDEFKQNLIDVFLPNYAPDVSESNYESMVDEIFEYFENFKEFALDEEEMETVSGGDVCTYVAPGVNINGSRRQSSINATDIQVQLMQTGTADGHDYGGTFGEPMEGEELIPFEYYAAGCSYQEIGASSPSEAIKAQIVAARSYALVRPFDMGNWRKLEQKNGKWILYTAGSTTDQVYCSLEKGCSSSKTTDASDACQWGMVYSGTDHGTQCQGPLDPGHKLYQIRSEMAGKVLVDQDGYIIYTGFGSDLQNSWKAKASGGSDYTQILLSSYASKGAVEVKQMQCSSAGGDYRSWKQYDEKWGSIPLSPSSTTMAESGCLVTSIASLIAKSGVATNVDGEFNPGTFVKALSKVNSFSSEGDLVSLAKPSQIAPDFQFEKEAKLTGKGNQSDVNKIKKFLDQGYYIVAQVSNDNTAQHFVAIDTVEGNSVKIMDPGFEEEELFPTYTSTRIILYKKGN